jgi:hypothetical protein
MAVIGTIRVAKVISAPTASAKKLSVDATALKAIAGTNTNIQTIAPIAVARVFETEGVGCGPVAATDVTVDIPGHPEFENAEEVFDSLFYVAPSASMSCTPSVVEVGATVDDVALAWSYNKAVVSQSINQGVGSLTDIDQRTVALSGLGLTTARTWTLTGNDGTGNCSASAGVAFMHKRCWGLMDTEIPDQTILEGFTFEFASSRVQSRTINGGGKYPAFVWPVAWGDPTFTVNGLVMSAWTKYTVSFTNSLGYTENLAVYRWNNKQSGSAIVTVVS